MGNKKRVSALVIVMGLLAVYFIDVSAATKKRCTRDNPYSSINKKAKTDRNRQEAKNEPFENHLRKHAALRVQQYFELLMAFNMCPQYNNLEFKDIFRFGAKHQDTKGTKGPGTDIATVDATYLKSTSTFVATFQITHAAHVCGIGLKNEPVGINCDLRGILEKIISRTTEQVDEVNLNIDKVVDQEQFDFGKFDYRNAKKLTRNHFKDFIKRLEKSIESHKGTIKISSKYDDDKKSRLEFYADTYLDVIKNLEWRDICYHLESCAYDGLMALADQENWQVKKAIPFSACH